METIIWAAFTSSNLLLGQKSLWTNVCLGKSSLEKILLGQLCPWTIVPWTVIAAPSTYFKLNRACHSKVKLVYHLINKPSTLYLLPHPHHPPLHCHHSAAQDHHGAVRQNKTRIWSSVTWLLAFNIIIISYKTRRYKSGQKDIDVKRTDCWFSQTL